MADNFKILEPSSGGRNVGADEISSVLYPRHKLVFGADGVNSGDVAIANGLPVGPAQAGAYEALVEKIHSFYTTSYQSLGLTNIATCRLLIITNFTDTFLLHSFDDGTTHHVIVPPGITRTVTVPSGTSQVHARYSSSAGLPSPLSGYCWYEVIR
mgnify:CR=1 FL=1